MKRTSASLKLIARQQLSGNYGTPMAGILLLGLCSFLPSFFISSTMDTGTTMGLVTSQILVYVISLLVSVLKAGYSKMMVNICRGKSFEVKDLAFAFTHHPDRFIIVHLIILIVQFVIGLPFNIPLWTDNSSISYIWLSVLAICVDTIVALVLNLFLAVTDYLLLDDINLSAVDAMKKSCSLMKGNKWRYFYINLSFIPLLLASMLTCYIGLLWLMPYMEATMAAFYLDLKGEFDKKEEPVIEIEAKPEITFDDFMKMQFQVGEIISCEAVPKSKKLLCSQVKIGSQVKQIVSGIRKHYTPEEMVGKKVMVLVNLKPAKLAGVLSEGMLLCAEDAEGNLALMTPEKAMPAGAEIC